MRRSSVSKVELHAGRARLPGEPHGRVGARGVQRVLLRRAGGRDAGVHGHEGPDVRSASAVALHLLARCLTLQASTAPSTSNSPRAPEVPVYGELEVRRQRDPDHSGGELHPYGRPRDGLHPDGPRVRPQEFQPLFRSGGDGSPKAIDLLRVPVLANLIS